MFSGPTWSKPCLRKLVFLQRSELSQKQCQSFASNLIYMQTIQSSKILLSQNIIYIFYWKKQLQQTVQHVRATVSETERQVIGIS